MRPPLLRKKTSPFSHSRSLQKQVLYEGELARALFHPPDLFLLMRQMFISPITSRTLFSCFPPALLLVWVQDVMEPAGIGKENKEEKREKQK